MTETALLKSCKELREALRLAVLVLIGEDADQRLLELCLEQGIDGQVMIRAGEAIERYETDRKD